ncbi:MAG: glycogen debranching protein GlgX [Planctomycetota bacterium]
MRVCSGQPYPLGATWNGSGVNFALFSEHATAVELCLFGHPRGEGEEERIVLHARTEGVWHVFVPSIGPGQLYGYRVNGPYDPGSGHRFNSQKLLIDPYARALAGSVEWNDVLVGFDVNDRGGEAGPDGRDSGPWMPKAVVVDPAFNWGDDCPPGTPWERTVIYECHVKGMTALHLAVPPGDRGRYLGLASEAVIRHLQELGVTAVELLPVHQCATERRLAERRLHQYWGYNTIGYFAPDCRFASRCDGGQVGEFKAMVRRLHRAGIEVILDVVYNHTGEGDHEGPTLGFRGIDNRSYYAVSPEDPRRYVDRTGCGNTLELGHPRVFQMMMDSLRYWAIEMRVDGFRFDLAPAMCEPGGGEAGLHRFFGAIRQDPVLATRKLIVEPWCCDADGTRLGRFPSGYSEWNNRFQETIRRFWRGDEGQIAGLAFRLSGSNELFGKPARGTSASINYVACHDGFTLEDVVSYERKRNEANGWLNADGPNDNQSCNWGEEGPTTCEGVRGLRRRVKRNLLATLAFSQGVPMILAGDELGRTQRGNSNAYCQDNESSWIQWRLDPGAKDLLSFAQRIFRLRGANPVFRRRGFLDGHAHPPDGRKDVTWLRPDGSEMEGADWYHADRRVLGMLLEARASDELDESGRRVDGIAGLLIFNAAPEDCTFCLPQLVGHGWWQVELDSAWDDEEGEACDGASPLLSGTATVMARSMLLLHWHTSAAAEAGNG